MNNDRQKVLADCIKEMEMGDFFFQPPGVSWLTPYHKRKLTRTMHNPAT
jgi:hypothetical protein